MPKTAKKPMPDSLRQKMAASVAGTSPSLVPQFDVSKVTFTVDKKVEEEVVPSIDDLIADDVDRTMLRDLIANHVQLNRQKKQLEKSVETLGARIKSVVTDYGVDKMMCDGAKVSLTRGERRTINSMKLVASGVPQDLIEACTDISRFQTLTITEV